MNLRSLTEAQCLKIMDEFLDKQDEPEVGFFWYDPKDRILFGVTSVPASQVGQINTIGKLHKQVWAKEKNKRASQGLPLGLWEGDYKDIPRGRVFKADDGYLVKMGSWINNYPEAKEKILEEFNLRGQDVEFEIDTHWEIGEGYEGGF